MSDVYAVHLEHDGGSRCGKLTRTDPQLTADESNVTCLRCTTLLAGTYNQGMRWSDVKPCGTNAAYRRHKRHGEKPCESCRQAHHRYNADAKRRRRERKALAA